jgi:signal transduction histidine kinase
MKIKQSQQNVYRSPAESSRFIAETDDLLRTSVDYVRTLMAELYPSQLHALGLPAALRSLAGQMPRHGLTVDLSISCEALSIPDDTVLLLYQSVRELLMNIVKHAAVNRACVMLQAESDGVCITVQDYGRGFDASTMKPSVPGQHFGLQSVRDRLTAIGGTFMVDSIVGKGTSIALAVPLNPLSEATVLRAASAARTDRIGTDPAELPNQQSLLL